MALQENLHKEAHRRLAANEILLTTKKGGVQIEEGEKTVSLTQADILEEADMGSAAKRFDLELSFGPYVGAYSRSGRDLLIAGMKGSVAIFNTQTYKLVTEMNVKSTVRDVTFLHNETMFATAEKKYLHIYDNSGIELHCMDSFHQPLSLEFLPYHFLLVTAGESSLLKYLDVSTGEVVATHRMKKGPTEVMRQNPENAVIHCGHKDGTVTLWTPNVRTPVLEMFCHYSNITALGIRGDRMVTASTDGRWRLWDLRMGKPLFTKNYGRKAPRCLDISQTGLVAMGLGTRIHVYNDLFERGVDLTYRPYLGHLLPRSQVASVKFQPFEDVLFTGHSTGISTVLVPGAGLANFDAFESNPYESTKQRREREVHQLLEKLQPSMITLDNTRFGGLKDASIIKRRNEDDDE